MVDDMTTTKHAQKPQERYAWPVKDWAEATGLCRASVYNLLGAGKIESVKYGKKRLIATHPKDFIASLSNGGA
jgi:hypothetical protein